MKGRCAGCEYEGSIKAVESHQRGCEKFAGLFRDSPEKALDPAAEFRRVASARVAGRTGEPRSQERKSPKPRPRSAESEPVSDREPGSVEVEYWSWPVTMFD